MTKPIIIVGAGLSGLLTAYRLEQAGKDYLLLEGRDRLGGRVASFTSQRGNRYDLGATWFWPDFEPHIKELVAELSLAVFEQYKSGQALIDSSPFKRLSGES